MVRAAFATDFRVLVGCAAVLYLKFLGTCMIQGRKAFAAGTRAPEDRALPMAANTPTETSAPYERDDKSPDILLEPLDEKRALAIEDELRWKRIIQNDLESVPLALVVFFLAVSTGRREALNAALIGVYTVARILHTIVYAMRQPWLRMGAWMVGIACILVAALSASLTVVQAEAERP